MSRVFLAEPMDRHDLSDTQRYGEIVYLSNDRRFGFDPKTIADVLRERLSAENFNAETDFICLSGNILVVSILVAVVLEIYGIVPMLVFNAKSSGYVDRELLLEEVKL